MKIIVGDAATWHLVRKYLNNIVIENGGVTPEERDRLNAAILKAELKTYAEITASIAGDNLISGQMYVITDYQTVHTIPNTSDINTGVVEPLVVSAISTNKLAPEAYSLLYPQDIIYYDIENNQSMVDGCTKGYIYRRIDTKQSNDFPIDFRNAITNVGGARAKVYGAEVNYNSCFGNTFAQNDGALISNFNNRFGSNFKNNSIGNNFYSNSIGDSFSYNSIGNSFSSNSIGNNLYNNNIGNNFQDNSIGNDFQDNSIGNDFYNNIISDSFQNVSGTAYGITFTAEHGVYGGGEKELFRNSAGKQFVKFYDEYGVLTIISLD